MRRRLTDADIDTIRDTVAGLVDARPAVPKPTIEQMAEALMREEREGLMSYEADAEFLIARLWPDIYLGSRARMWSEAEAWLRAKAEETP